jgi:tetratricopeptide (TPR) repeat protein
MSSRYIRLKLLLVLICGYFYGTAQNFEGPWVLIHAHRLDGSRIIERGGGIDEYFERSFTKKHTINVDSSTYAKVTSTSSITILDSKHATSLGKNFELASDSILVVTDNYGANIALDKVNRYYFLRRDRYLNYLKTTPLFILENDSTILANSHIFPRHESKKNNYTFQHYLYRSISPCAGAVTGSFIVNKNKEIVDIQMAENRSFDKWEWLVVALKKTSGEWDLPLEGYYYRVQFTLATTEGGNNIDITFKPHDFEWFTKDHLGISGDQARLKQSLFERGEDFIKKGNHEKAIESFTKLIETDALFLDAFYNRAYSYLQLNQLDKACIDWGYLKDLEQVTAVQLFNKHCKK